MTIQEHSPTPSTETPHQGCVIVVDDHTALRELLVMALEMAGHTVVSAANPLELHRHLARLTPAAVIVNVQRSEADGLRLIKQLRAERELQDAPILFLSGSDDDILRWEAAEAGADYVGVRPLGMLALQAEVDRLLHLGRPVRPHGGNPRPPAPIDRYRRAARLRRTG